MTDVSIKDILHPAKKRSLWCCFIAVLLTFVMLANHHDAFTQPYTMLLADSTTLLDTAMVNDTKVTPSYTASVKDFLLTQQILHQHPYFNYAAKAMPMPYQLIKKPAGRELYFYIIAGILLVFAVFRTAFDKYFSDLMALFFKRSLKQRQLKQQVTQNSLPSLLFNILYTVVAGFYIALLIADFGATALPFWQLLIYAITFIAIIYIIKYLLLKLAGWMFQLSSITDDYIFIIFFINKMIGIALLPVIVVVPLGGIELKSIMLTLSWLLLAGLLLYRFISAFGLLRKERNFSSIHFILYLLGFEIIPVLVIYKALAVFLNL